MQKKYGREAVASFLVVGLGQIIKGEGNKGLILILLFYFVLPAALYVSLMISAFLFLLVLVAAVLSGIALWTYNVWDAMNCDGVLRSSKSEEE